MQILTQLLKHRKRWAALCLLTADVICFGMTDPTTVASSVLVAGLLLLTINLMGMAYGAVLLAIKAGLTVEPQYQRAVVGGGAVVALLFALQSVGQLSGRDIAVVVPFAIVSYVYLTYARPAPKT